MSLYLVGEGLDEGLRGPAQYAQAGEQPAHVSRRALFKHPLAQFRLPTTHDVQMHPQRLDVANQIVAARDLGVHIPDGSLADIQLKLMGLRRLYPSLLPF